MSEDVNDYLEEGIFGPKELKPDEKRKYLGTFRERILAVLTRGQVIESRIYPEIAQLLKDNPEVKMLLNGNIQYDKLSNYIKLCNENSITYSITSNLDYNSEIGLVLAFNYAIDKEEIEIKDTETKPMPTTENGLKGWIKKLLE